MCRNYAHSCFCNIDTDEIWGSNVVQNLPVPARNTIALRSARLDPEKTITSREGPDGARDMQGVGGVPPMITAPLEQIQIDHTIVYLNVVDERDRQPNGRPYLTIAIDVFARCVSSMVVTLQAPSAVSVGLWQQALTLLRKIGVRILVIDELHNILAGNSVNRRECVFR